MDTEIRAQDKQIFIEKLGIVFHYSRPNIYSYHTLIGALETNMETTNIPVFIPKPEEFIQQITNLFAARNFERLIIGLSMSTFQLQDYLKILKKLAAHPNRSRMLIIAGGPHPSADPEPLLKQGVDVVVIGEGELTFPNIVASYRKGEDYRNQYGICYFDDSLNQAVYTSTNYPVCLDEFPPFAPGMELYSAIEITRGCKYNCSYCQVPSLFGKNVRYRSPENVIKWGKFLLSKRDNWDFRFITPNAFGYGSKVSSKPNLEMIEQLLSGLFKLEAKKRRRTFFGTFPSEVRPESVTEGTLDLTRKYCDNRNLTMGAQSGSPEILKKIHRGHTIEQVLDAVQLANSFGFRMNIDFIIGFPEETTADQYKTIDLCKRLKQLNCKIHMHYLIPLPGTIYEKRKPSSIDPEILAVLRKWSNDGTIFGSWQHQYNLVTNIHTEK